MCYMIAEKKKKAEKEHEDRKENTSPKCYIVFVHNNSCNVCNVNECVSLACFQIFRGTNIKYLKNLIFICRGLPTKHFTLGSGRFCIDHI